MTGAPIPVQDADWAAMRAALEVCQTQRARCLAELVHERVFARCARSAEWRAGAFDGLCLAAGLAFTPSPYAPGSAQDDAWNAGHLAGVGEWKSRRAGGRLPSQPGWEGA